MSIWNKITGHKRQQAMMRSAAAGERLAHAFLFVGPEGIGKSLFARNIAQALLCEQTEERELDACGKCSGCKQVLAQTHPDLLEIGLPEGKAEIPIELIAGAGDRRGKEGLLHELSLRSMAGGRRIAILDQAEKLNLSSANALLKTLEEPPEDAILILITSDLERMLDTIRSRCQSLFFGALRAEEIRVILEQRESNAQLPASDSIPESLLQSGSLRRALEVSVPEIHQLRESVDQQCQQSPINPVAIRARLTAILDELGGDTRQQRKYAGMIIQFAVEFWSRELNRSAKQSDREKQELEASLLDRCLTSQEELSRNVSVPLCLDSLWNDLSRIQKKHLAG